MARATSATPGQKALQFPYSAICLIEDTIPGVGDFRASGVIIGPHTILTASHVLWNADVQAGASSVRVFPGYSSSSTKTPSSGALAGAESWHYFEIDDHSNLITRLQSQSDFAIIDTATDLSSYGSFGLATDYSGGEVTVSGYPANHQYLQTQTTGQVTSDSSVDVLNFDSFSATPGASGGPLWIDAGTAQNPKPSVVGLVSTTGWASKLTAGDVATIEAWEASDAALWNSGTDSSSSVLTPPSSGQSSASMQAPSTPDAPTPATSGTTYVFNAGQGHEVITPFVFRGLDHDTISLPQSDASHLAQIIAHGTMDADGATTLHLGGQDAITLAGVSVTQLQHHKSVFTFHA